MTTTKKRRHSAAEISAKRAKVGECAAQVRSQTEIAEGFGISIKTYQRWRKVPNQHVVSVSTPSIAPSHDECDPPRRSRRVAELRLENLRLRRLVADLLLENPELAKVADLKSLSQNARRKLLS